MSRRIIALYTFLGTASLIVSIGDLRSGDINLLLTWVGFAAGAGLLLAILPDLIEPEAA